MNVPKYRWLFFAGFVWLTINPDGSRTWGQIPIVRPAAPANFSQQIGFSNGLIPVVQPSANLQIPIETPQEQVSPNEFTPLIPIESKSPGNAVPVVPRASDSPPIVKNPLLFPPVVTPEKRESATPAEFQSFLAPIAVVPQPPSATNVGQEKDFGPVAPRLVIAPSKNDIDLDGGIEPKVLTENGESPRIARAPKIEPGRQDYFTPTPLDGMSMGNGSSGCPNCGGAGCAACNGGSWGDQSQWGWDSQSGSGFGHDSFINFDNCGFVPRATYYGIFDALYWTRTDGSYIGTTFGGLTGFGYDWGFRGTLGWRMDQVTGYELAYTGIMPLEQSRQILRPSGGINALFEPAGGFNLGNVSAFFNIVEANQFADTRFHSVELNKVRWGWDIVKTHIGLRYIYFDDRYLLRVRNLANVQGEMELTARNHLIGPNIGIDLFYDVGRRVSFSWFAKAGGYANGQRTTFEFTNNGIQLVDNRDTNTRFSASVDGGVNAHVHLHQNARLRGGYSLIYLYKVASAADNYPAFVTPLTGLTSDTRGTLFFHGATFGLEFYR